MHSDDELRERFHTVAHEDETAAPELVPAHLHAWRSTLLRQSRRTWTAGMIAGMAAGAVMMLTIGLVLGASTGYASAEEILKERGDTPLPPRPALTVLKNIPAISVLACGERVHVEPAQTAQQGVPIVDLPVPTVKTAAALGGVTAIRQISNGGVIVNDAGNRQMKLFDSTLTLQSIVRDSAAGTATSYGPRGIPMTPYLGDSTILADYNAGTMVVMGPNGQGRAMAPLSSDMVNGFAIGPTHGGVDDKARFVYTVAKREDPMLGLARAKIPDSSVLVRADLDARRIDTLARLKSSGTTKLLGREGNGPVRFSTEPLPLTDDWALLSDGSIAVVRGRDYHIDWILPDGSTKSGPKLPFDWKRISDEQKQHLIDSVRDQVGERMGRALGQRRADPPPDQPPGQPGQRRAGGEGVTQGPPMPTEYIAPALSEMFDYWPALRRGAVKADLDGNVWILPTTSAQSRAGELVYDVVNAKGDFHRVRFPAGRSLAGFGKGGVVYLLSGDKASGFYLEKTKVPSGKK